MIKVLIVDDEERMIVALKKNIRWKMCGVDYYFTAENMDDALQCYYAYKPDIIITDIEMPDGSGLELIERLRSENEQVTCICVTCHPEFAYMRRAMQLGSVDYVLKPVAYDELESVIKKTVEKINRDKVSELGKTENNLQDQTDFLYEDDKLMISALEYIREHLIENISVQTVADCLHCSTSHLMRVFKRKTGKTIIEYVTGERIEKARSFLKNSDLQINVIAELSGYEDYSYFTRVFKKETGETPREYRNRHRVDCL